MNSFKSGPAYFYLFYFYFNLLGLAGINVLYKFVSQFSSRPFVIYLGNKHKEVQEAIFISRLSDEMGYQNDY